jgi:hypothetical protein
MSTNDILNSGEAFVLLFLIPVAGFYLDRYLSVKKLWLLIGVTTALLLFYAFGYQSPIPLFFQFLYVASFGSGVGLFFKLIKKDTPKVWISLLLTFLLMLPSIFLFFVGAFGGGKEVKRVCQSYYYQVDLVNYSAFSGKPVSNFELRKYTVIPIFYQYLDEVTIEENQCKYTFEKVNKIFDSCKKEITDLK